jgi:DNA uptake protein ComE-like DNA-binding protein
VVSSPTDLQDFVQIAPEWRELVRGLVGQGRLAIQEVFSQIGAQAIFAKALSLTEERGRFLVLVRDGYFQPLLFKMLSSNQNLRRFWSQRRMSAEDQRQHAMSFSVDLSHKMEGVLIKQLNLCAEDGFKVLLPAYIQRSVHNAIVDYIRQEWAWERQTLQDLNLDPEQDDPRQVVADDLRYTPESQALSSEQVTQLNELRKHLVMMLADPSLSREPLTVLDCIFGMGLTESSVLGQEMTMREVCGRLNIPGETPARRIARCQVLLDKGLDMVRQYIRENLPGIVSAWQGDLNVNSASRRELSQQLGMTEGEVERLVVNRQYRCLEDLVSRGVVKQARLKDLKARGAVAAFVPVDINSCTVRDMIDILGLAKEAAQRLASERPFTELTALVARGLLDKQTLDRLIGRGAVLRVAGSEARRIDLNRVDAGEITGAGVPEQLAEKIINGRPFLTWSELEDFLGCDSATWATIRGKFCLGLVPG